MEIGDIGRISDCTPTLTNNSFPGLISKYVSVYLPSFWSMYPTNTMVESTINRLVVMYVLGESLSSLTNNTCSGVQTTFGFIEPVGVNVCLITCSCTFTFEARYLRRRRDRFGDLRFVLLRRERLRRGDWRRGMCNPCQWEAEKKVRHSVTKRFQMPI